MTDHMNEETKRLCSEIEQLKCGVQAPNQRIDALEGAVVSQSSKLGAVQRDTAAIGKKTAKIERDNGDKLIG